MGYEHIQFSGQEGGIAVVTLNRPEKLNALNASLLTELDAALTDFETNPALTSLIVTGAGDKAFAAGADLTEIPANGVQARMLAERGQRIFRRLELSPKPSVAAINGYALGGGLELAMACTMRVAVETAKLGQPEVRLGLTPGYGGTQRLARLAGRGKALELLLTGDQITAQQAFDLGLVNHVVAAAELMPFCRELLRRIAANGPDAVALIMQAVDIGLSSGFDEGSRYEAAAFGLSATTEDSANRIRAFLEKKR
jgi:enoyl-CoA hydratase